ncbi:hypothetical protein RGR602_CH03323 [Rhizobium gallicum bv. gallicum R602sp]|uniref:Uncharacterized protein n=1 Tax=Rhizobium gallicum bv. gallicum R602sp TaxID=1041138 RepID=A0A0B4X824_9HYPH|nr:hypothetical protein RGR602_CH03323 [Rhizobium gallicum bv. gallicum R602sp]
MWVMPTPDNLLVEVRNSKYVTVIHGDRLPPECPSFCAAEVSWMPVPSARVTSGRGFHFGRQIVLDQAALSAQLLLMKLKGIRASTAR